MTPEQLRQLEALAQEVPEEEPLPEEPASVHGIIPPAPRTAYPSQDGRKRAPRKVQTASKPDTPTVCEGGNTVRSRRVKWPFEGMHVDQWFPVEDSDQHHKARLAASAYGRRNGKRFECNLNEQGVLIVTRRS